MSQVIECLYCKSVVKQHKSRKSRVPVEHVVCKMLGSFENNMTLKNIVCQKCNNDFSKLELSLGRDSVYGILYRSIVALLDKETFKKSTQHPRKKLFLKMNHVEYGHVLVNLELTPDTLFEVSLTDQFIFLNSTKGVSVHYPVDQLPHKSQLDALGLPMRPPIFSFLGREINPNEFQLKTSKIEKALQAAEIQKFIGRGRINKQPPLDQNSPLLFSSYVDEEIIRVVSKIGFNYFTYIFGHGYAIKDYFNDLRHFIRYGLKPNYKLVTLNKYPINENIDTLHNDNFGQHQVSIFQNGHDIIARIILFKRDVFDVLLTKEYPLIGGFFQSSHIFCLKSKTIRSCK
ncbi:TPA: hypothetical protein ACT9AU_001887 [Legionella pneumophila]|nr:hypothetical protein [Legionella pneumophila]HAU0941348.1 hypothetical protein [Legionella pneumophila]HDO7873621.1 hypothetical protein [Legionella pneumophila]HDO7940520.1 hypothetical protein [Legionella pneumophila]HDO8157864.1 hypothetical protein [Legionella pneumophila]